MLHLGFERKAIFFVAMLLTAIAVFAVALTPALSDQVRPMLQSLGIISCTSSGPCQEGKNASTGPGLEGISAKGKGVIGQTTFNSTSTTNGQAGVLGQDKSTSGAFDVGVKGTSTNGIGVLGTSGSFLGCGTLPGVCGTAGTGNGVYGASTNDNGGEFHAGVGVASAGRSGVFANDDSTSGSSNFGGFFSSSRGVGLEGFSDTGTGLVGHSNNSVGANVTGGLASGSLPALSILANIPSDFIDACAAGIVNPCDELHSVVRIDGVGDILTNGGISSSRSVGASGDINSGGNFNIDGIGQYRKNGSCVAGCSMPTSGSAGRAVVTYAPMASQPVVEDFGEAQLVTGQTYVPLDSKFANVIEQNKNYLVFITPEGDANVLYVTQKSSHGFEVRESHGGRSSIPFSFRIVATPYGSHAARLPMVQVPKLQRLRVGHTPGSTAIFNR